MGIIQSIKLFITGIYLRYFAHKKAKFGYLGKNVELATPLTIKGHNNVFLHDNTNIYAGALIIATRAKFIMKDNSGAAEGLTAICGGHMMKVGRSFKSIKNDEKTKELDKDIIIEEDVWIGSNVTLLKGVTIGRGAVIGSGAVIRNRIPPYSIVIGNPAKIVGFKFNPDEIIEHEINLYPIEKRLSYSTLVKNNERYFVSQIENINKYLQNI